jgi:hypothetical protein
MNLGLIPHSGRQQLLEKKGLAWNVISLVRTGMAHKTRRTASNTRW